MIKKTNMLIGFILISAFLYAAPERSHQFTQNDVEKAFFMCNMDRSSLTISQAAEVIKAVKENTFATEEFVSKLTEDQKTYLLVYISEKKNRKAEEYKTAITIINSVYNKNIQTCPTKLNASITYNNAEFIKYFNNVELKGYIPHYLRKIYAFQSDELAGEIRNIFLTRDKELLEHYGI
ncbi:hypothetical protein Dip518_000241 [Parelusimicrobium proximum]|uniref:hypothetical protein n=1 Tax=Parelusimicrobium proximum TaxID=3228953 RepID=UPI003D16268F